MRALIIDDNRQFALDLSTALLNLEHFEFEDPQICTNPRTGIESMSHCFDIVFIDLKFDNLDISGADIALELRNQYPISTFILCSAFAQENINKFIHAGFDTYFEKDDDSDFDDAFENLKQTITTGLENAQHRFKSKFNDDELKDVKSKFDCINQILENHICVKIGEATSFGKLLQEGIPLEELENNSQEISKILKQKKGPRIYTSENNEEKKLITRTSLNTYLQMWKSEGTDYSNILKLRQLILEDRNRWPYLNNVKTFRNFLKRLHIK